MLEHKQFIHSKSKTLYEFRAVNSVGVSGVGEYFHLIVSISLVYYEPGSLAERDGGELLEAYHTRMCEIVDWKCRRVNRGKHNIAARC